MQGLRTGLTARWASSHSYNHMHGVKDHPPPPIPLTPCSLWEARRFAVSFAPKRLLQCEMALPGGRPPSFWLSSTQHVRKSLLDLWQAAIHLLVGAPTHA